MNTNDTLERIEEKKNSLTTASDGFLKGMSIILITIILLIGIFVVFNKENVLAARIKVNETVKQEIKVEETKTEENKKTEESKKKETTAAKKTEQRKIEAVEQEKSVANAQKQAEEAAKQAEAIKAAQLAQQQAQAQAIAQAQAQAQAIALEQGTARISNTNGFVGWSNQNNAWYFLDGGGKPIKNQFIDINGKTYHFNKEGIMETGWVTLMNGKYYFNKDGSLKINEWFQDIDKWYYASATGAIQTTDCYIDGQIYQFRADGEWIENPNEDNADGLGSLVKYVNNNIKKKQGNPTAETKTRIKEIIGSLPNSMLLKMRDKIQTIYVCTDADMEKVTTKYSKDEDGTSQKIEVPYHYSNFTLTICQNPNNLALALGEFVNKTYTYQQEQPHKSSLWKTYYNSGDAEIYDWDWMNSNTWGITFHGESAELLFESCVAYYILNPMELSEEAPKAYRNIMAIVGDRSNGAPMVD